MSLQRVVLPSSLLLGIFLCQIHFQTAVGQVRPRVVEAVDDARRTTLSGNVHPLARAEFDRGAVAESQPMNRILLLLRRSDEQEAALQDALAKQQDKSSPSFHQWLTPEQFGAQFGAADADIQAVTDWLTRQGFSIGKIYSGKTVIEFSGTAGQVQRAFGTAIHNYQMNGKLHSANSSDPQIPAALAPVITGVVSLHNFPRQFYSQQVGNLRRSAGKSVLEPLTTLPGAFGGNFYGLGPGDFAKIYKTPATCGTPAGACTGSGQTIAIVGETDINVTDVQQFQAAFGLPATFSISNVVYNGENPGITSTDEEGEADLDTQWSGGVAPGATVKYVVSASTSASQGVDLSALYIVEHNLAAVMSESYGACESSLGSAENSFYNNLWQQASAQGITVAVSTGDSGSAGCDDPHQESLAIAGPAVNGLASTPYNVAVGGTDFDEYTNWTTYWSAGNDPTTQTSAKGYIPEIPWNQSCAQLGASGCTLGTPPDLQNIVAGGGGPSSRYSKPSWQTGVAGVPTDSHRDLPDVSLMASPGFNGTGYLYCQGDIAFNGGVPCGQNSFGRVVYQVVGGTSASAPAFAGVMALVNQSQATAQNPAPRQGNANVVLYALANKAGAAGTLCASSTTEAASCVFNDITKGSTNLPIGGPALVGTNSVPCRAPAIDCSATTSGQFGVLVVSSGSPTEAWIAGTGYDLATGLGSLNIGNLVSNWGTVSIVPTTTTLMLSPTTGITHGAENVSATIGVTPKSGTATGTVSLIADLADGTTFGAGQFTLAANGSVTGTAQNLPGGSNYQVYAHYSGDGTNAPSDSTSVNVSVAQESSKTFIVVPTFDPATGNQTNGNASSVTYGTPYIVRMYVTNSAGTVNPAGAPTGACTQSSKVACPSGTIALTANGKAVDGGTFSLDSIGYTRDISPTLPGGTYPLAAAYSGDTSYQASQASETFTVNLAPTTLNSPSAGSNTPLIGQQISINTNVTSQAFTGVAPTGTVTFYDANTALMGPVSLTPVVPNGSQAAGLTAQISTTFTTPGLHTITANYSGDANYAGASSSGSLTLDAVYATTANVGINATTVDYGNTITVTGVIDTTVPSSNTALKPTGQVSLYGSTDGSITSGVTTTTIADAKGNWEIQLSATFKPSYTEVFSFSYNGDMNYASAFTTSPFITVNQPDFSITPVPSSLTITAGQTGTSSLTVAPLTGISSSVALTCSTPNMVGTTCSLNPASVNLSNNTSATTIVTLSTIGPSSGAAAALRRKSAMVFWEPGSNPGPLWASCLLLAALCVWLMTPRRRNRQRFLLRFAGACLFATAFGCGGGGGGGTGGGGGGGGGAVPTSVTITASATKVPSGNAPSVTLTAAISPASSAGTITFWENGNGGALAPSVSVVSGSASSQVALPLVGTHQIYAQYSGDASHLGSKSATVNVVATGTAYLQIQGVTGATTRYLPISVSIQ